MQGAGTLLGWLSSKKEPVKVNGSTDAVNGESCKPVDAAKTEEESPKVEKLISNEPSSSPVKPAEQLAVPNNGEKEEEDKETEEGNVEEENGGDDGGDDDSNDDDEEEEEESDSNSDNDSVSDSSDSDSDFVTKESKQQEQKQEDEKLPPLKLRKKHGKWHIVDENGAVVDNDNKKKQQQQQKQQKKKKQGKKDDDDEEASDIRRSKRIRSKVDDALQAAGSGTASTCHEFFLTKQQKAEMREKKRKQEEENRAIEEAKQRELRSQQAIENLKKTAQQSKAEMAAFNVGKTMNPFFAPRSVVSRPSLSSLSSVSSVSSASSITPASLFSSNSNLNSSNNNNNNSQFMDTPFPTIQHCGYVFNQPNKTFDLPFALKAKTSSPPSPPPSPASNIQYAPKPLSQHQCPHFPATFEDEAAAEALDFRHALVDPKISAQECVAMPWIERQKKQILTCWSLWGGDCGGSSSTQPAQGLDELLVSIIESRRIPRALLSPSTPAPLTSTSSLSSTSTTAASAIWTEKYRPLKASEVCGNVVAVTSLKEWLGVWAKRDRENQQKRSRQSITAMYYSDEEEDCIACGTILTGPTGVGKTATVYAIAEELKFNVIEIHPGAQRSGKNIKDMFREATESHGVQTSFEKSKKLADPSPSKKSRGKGSSSSVMATSLQSSIILIEEADILFEEDRGFVGAISSLLTTAKRPVILTANELMDPLTTLPLVHRPFRCVSTTDIVNRLQVISMLEGTQLSIRQSLDIAVACDGDIRAAINQAQVLAARPQMGQQITTSTSTSTRRTERDIATNEYPHWIPTFFATLNDIKSNPNLDWSFPISNAAEAMTKYYEERPMQTMNEFIVPFEAVMAGVVQQVSSSSSDTINQLLRHMIFTAQLTSDFDSILIPYHADFETLDGEGCITERMLQKNIICYSASMLLTQSNYIHLPTAKPIRIADKYHWSNDASIIMASAFCDRWGSLEEEAKWTEYAPAVRAIAAASYQQKKGRRSKHYLSSLLSDKESRILAELYWLCCTDEVVEEEENGEEEEEGQMDEEEQMDEDKHHDDDDDHTHEKQQSEI